MMGGPEDLHENVFRDRVGAKGTDVASRLDHVVKAARSSGGNAWLMSLAPPLPSSRAAHVVPQESNDVLATHHAHGMAVLDDRQLVDAVSIHMLQDVAQIGVAPRRSHLGLRDHDVLGPERGPRRSGLPRDPM